MKRKQKRNRINHCKRRKRNENKRKREINEMKNMKSKIEAEAAGAQEEEADHIARVRNCDQRIPSLFTSTDFGATIVKCPPD